MITHPDEVKLRAALELLKRNCHSPDALTAEEEIRHIQAWGVVGYYLGSVPFTGAVPHAEHARRVGDLLEANNILLERARLAEGIVARLGRDPIQPPLCETCLGKGKVYNNAHAGDMEPSGIVNCPACKGRGTV